MPRKEKLTKEEIVRAAAEVVRTGGEEALGARAIAKVLGCSTQPVYSQFGNMEALKRALFEAGKVEYRRAIEAYLAREEGSRYEAYGMGYVRFAREERGLFRLLFLRGGRIEDPFTEDILREMEALYRMPREKARAFHEDMATFSFGLAVLVYRGAPLSEAEISAALKREFYALYAYHFPERAHFWEESPRPDSQNRAERRGKSPDAYETDP